MKSGLKNNEAQEVLSKTDSAGKNELLFSKFGINYNKIGETFKKGSTIFRQFQSTQPFPKEANKSIKERVEEKEEKDEEKKEGEDNLFSSNFPVEKEVKKKSRGKLVLVCLSLDIISHSFWKENSYILN